MAHASMQSNRPELPTEIQDRIVSHHRGFDIAGHLRALEVEHPGLLDAVMRTIDMLESYPGVESTSIDYDEDDVLFPVTIWTRTSFTGEERFRHMVILQAKAEEMLRRYPEFVLVSIL
jgi:hypothetical protein